MHIPRPAVFHRQRRQAIRLSKQKNDCKNFWCKHQKTSGASAFFVGECIERLNNKHLHHLYHCYLCHHFYHCYRCYRCYQIAQLELLNRPFKRRMNFGVPIGTTKFTQEKFLFCSVLEHEQRDVLTPNENMCRIQIVQTISLQWTRPLPQGRQGNLLGSLVFF